MTVSALDAQRMRAAAQWAVNTANDPRMFYSQRVPGRCDVPSLWHDCSGEVCAALKVVNAAPADFCTGSFGLARMCYEAGGQISIEQARITLFALVFLGINEGRGGIPGVDEGHVAISLGNGLYMAVGTGQIVQAANFRAGIIVSGFDWDRWSGAYLPKAWFPTVEVGWQHAQPAPDPTPQPVRRGDVSQFFRDDLHVTSKTPERGAIVQWDGSMIWRDGAVVADNSSSEPPLKHAVVAPGFVLVDAHVQAPANYTFQYAEAATVNGKCVGFVQWYTDPKGAWHPYHRAFRS